MEERSDEHKVRWNIKQSAKGVLYWEVTVKGEDNNECKRLMEEAIGELKRICDPKNYL